MPKLIFVNLPVTDLDKSIAFYKELGGEQNMQFSDSTAACMVLSETIHVMLLTHAKFRQFTTKAIPDAHESSQVLLCVSAESRQNVDEILGKAAGAGARLDPTPVQDFGFMYGRSYEDPDGHIWEVMWMDVEAAQAAMSETAAA